MSKQYTDIDRLISLYLSHRASESEKQELEAWLQASVANREVFERLKKIWCMPSHDGYHADMDKVRDQIWRAGTEQKQRVPLPIQQRVDVFYWSKVAAAFLIFLFGAWMFSSLVKENISVSTKVKLPESSALAVQTNPAGQKSIHMLPDSTKVWLNAESSLTYPEKFTNTLRLVQLKGEAFFEVAKDRKRPFIVETASIRTQALGTAFNIHAYPENDMIKIALLAGKVQVQDVDQHQTAFLSPGEELLAPKDRSDFRKQSFNYEKTFGWKEGILLFDGADFDDFCTAIEKWYGVTVKVNGTPPNDWNIRARYQHEDLRHVLRDVCFNKNIKFELHDKNVLITF